MKREKIFRLMKMTTARQLPDYSGLPGGRVFSARGALYFAAKCFTTLWPSRKTACVRFTPAFISSAPE